MGTMIAALLRHLVTHAPGLSDVNRQEFHDAVDGFEAVLHDLEGHDRVAPAPEGTPDGPAPEGTPDGAPPLPPAA